MAIGGLLRTMHALTEKLWKSMKANHQFEYVEGQMRPHHPALLQDFERQGELAARQAAQLDVAYGAHARQRLDVFEALEPAQGVLLYLHAGYWQSRDKALFRWLAPRLNQRGLHVVFANYPLCPEVSLDQLIAMLAPAVERAHGLRPGWERLPLVIAGHSAGAHLATEFALSHGRREAGCGRVDGIWAISGIYDLQPLCGTTLNQRLQLTLEQARALSPLHRAASLALPATWLVGAGETTEFLRQNRGMHEAWKGLGNWSQCAEAPGADHFTVLRDWDAMEHGLRGAWDAWWSQVLQRHAVR